jgi:hypothetical protein
MTTTNDGMDERLASLVVIRKEFPAKTLVCVFQLGSGPQINRASVGSERLLKLLGWQCADALRRHRSLLGQFQAR